MLSPLAQRLLDHIRKCELMRPGDRVAIAVSGGADSVALLRLMLELRGELGVVLSVAHFNHKIRGQASDDDEAFVRDLATQHALEFHCGEADVPAHARENKQSLETAARELRYDFFRRVMVSHNFNKVATAHTIDDQAETVLMRIIRGTGTGGLAAIQPRIEVRHEQSKIGELVRPLLRVRRPELETFLASVRQAWREDASNADLHHTRNRIRQLVMPMLEREFNPSIRDRLAELAEIARAEEGFWKEHTSEIMGRTQSVIWGPDVNHDEFFGPVADFDSSASQQTPAEGPIATDMLGPNVSIVLKRMEQLSLAEQRRIVRAAMAHIYNFTFQEVDRILQLARGETSGEIELAFGFRAWRDGDGVTLGTRRDRTAIVENGTFQVTIPLVGTSAVRIPDATLLISPRCGTGLAGAIHLLKLAAPELLLRPWRPGDRFWPQHSSGPKKVKELLTDKHITGRERKLWPVIACGDDIVWLRGFGVSHQFVAPEGATNAIVITEQPLDAEHHPPDS